MAFGIILECHSAFFDPQHPRLTVQQQCGLLGVPRSSYYYEPRPESAENLRLLRRLDELYLQRPFFSGRRDRVLVGGSRRTVSVSGRSANESSEARTS